MFKHMEIQSLQDFFQAMDERKSAGVYFYRINGYSKEVGEFIRAYYEAARKCGVIIEGKLQNPDEKNLSYYNEIMGMVFELSIEFISVSLKKWLPRMNDHQRENVALSLYDSLFLLQKEGKTEYMLKNAYIKCMCWLYYRFERIVNQLGENTVPKILYEGTISQYELMILSILSNAGCDAVLLQYSGDAGYLKLDPPSQRSRELKLPGLQPFPPDFSLKQIREEVQEAASRQRLYGQLPKRRNCTNAWITGDAFSDLKTPAAERGQDPGLFYNCFCRINGAEDKLTYPTQLYQFQLELKNSGRKLVIVNGGLGRPSMEEIAAVKRNHYTRPDQLILDLSSNIRYPADVELQRIMVRAFVDVLLLEIDDAQSGQVNLNKLTNRAVYLLCWLQRYQGRLFADWKEPDISCFILMGGCRDENEALFVSFLARLPVDVLLLCPRLEKACCLQDRLLYEVNYGESAELSVFPEENADVLVGTAAYHAERELDTLMYQDSGIYRDRQYERANTVILQTMYEEIGILWNEEVKYRPSFSTQEDAVHIPVIFAKVSGVKDGQIAQYWRSIRELVTEDTFVIRAAPFLDPTASNPMRTYAAGFYKNGRLLKDKIKAHPNYPYGYLREEIQDYILEKLKLVIDQKVIKGTFENGTEYLIIATVLNLPKEIVRLIQKFDFTKKNPKLLYIHTTEAVISLEDAILAAFLNRVGFDIVFFVPTGYQNVEKHFNRKIMEEHQIGEYLYDLRVPSLESTSFKARTKWRDLIFKRGK
ncbi:MAG: YceG family protein [Eubacterium sp.]|nr:YceG family protein [Eubacterium sp.]